ncbi:MAG: metallophosphoesterase family protein [Candidatus Riflebacteria bacterium]|nr:metallophosphoesterase family protein [Candidatus Riflebacteria bacterium]
MKNGRLLFLKCLFTLFVFLNPIFAYDGNLKFNSDGTFKIMQLTDIHFQPEEGKKYKQKYNSYVSEFLKSEKPDLVIITGDTCYWSRLPMQSYFDNALEPVINSKIPWALTLGNHDLESTFTGKEIVKYLQTKPFSLVRPGPQSLGASGNYTLEVKSAKSDITASVLYLLDSHSHHKTFINYSKDLENQLRQSEAKPDYQMLFKKHGILADEIYYAICKFDNKKMAAALMSNYDITLESGKVVSINKEDFSPNDNLSTGYDWISLEQINWYCNRSEYFTRRNNGIPLPSLMFFHIPLPEYSQILTHGKLIGERLETECPPKRNSGMFAAILEKHDVMGIFVGHDHVNDYTGFMQGVALAYGKKTGMGAYGPVQNNYGCRIIVLHEGKSSFETWVRTISGKAEKCVNIPDSFQ